VTYYATPEDATLQDRYSQDADDSVLAELAAEEVAAWTALTTELDSDYDLDLDDYEVRQALYLG